ncbi:MAG TPA: hypothetical protein VK932_07515 [Kofleriaceae bacterium]|nr:hypothetical protein [Kofleriaceae bacterium]
MAQTSLPARFPRAARALAFAFAAGLLVGATAEAEAEGDPVSAARPPAPDRTGAGDRDMIDVVPERCARFAVMTMTTDDAGRPRSADGWRQLLSLAACVQDGSIAAVHEPAELEPMLDELSRRLALPMMVYLDALEHAEASIQLRAAFQIGMAYVGLSTRARSAIAAPPDLATNAAAASRYRELHGRLEPLLAPARRAAWVSFRAIDEAAAMDATLATNEVERNMVCAARRLLGELRDAAPEPLRMLADRPACAGAPVTAAAW